MAYPVPERNNIAKTSPWRVSVSRRNHPAPPNHFRWLARNSVTNLPLGSCGGGTRWRHMNQRWQHQRFCRHLLREISVREAWQNTESKSALSRGDSAWRDGKLRRRVRKWVRQRKI